MKLPKNRVLLTALLTTVTAAGACNSDEGNSSGGNGDGDMGDGDGDGDGDLPGDGDGDGDLPGDGDGDGDMGGQGGAPVGGAGGAGPERVCGTPDGMGGGVICREVPEACGDPADYPKVWVDSLGNHHGGDVGATAEDEALVFLLDGDDHVHAHDRGSCIIGGTGDDTFSLGGEGDSADIIVGGPGADTFTFIASQDDIKVIADFEPGQDLLQPKDNIFGIQGQSPDEYVAIVPDFDGTSAQVPNDETLIIYDPNSGALWHDPDGSEVESSPTQFAILTNAAAVNVDDFHDYSKK